jgi:hypothetical protein
MEESKRREGSDPVTPATKRSVCEGSQVTKMKAKREWGASQHNMKEMKKRKDQTARRKFFSFSGPPPYFSP